MPTGASPISRPIAFRDDEIARMRAAEAAPATPLVDRYHLCFALGKALEDRGELRANPGNYYERGNALKRAESRYRPEITETNTRRQNRGVHARSSSPRAAAWASASPIRSSSSGCRGRARRSSSRSWPRIRRSRAPGARRHPAHRPELQGRDTDLDNPRYPGVLASFGLRTSAPRRALLADTRVYRTGKPFFIDKMPNNFRHIGLIHLMLPNAKIIDARREPMACCFSNLKQLFARGQEFTYSLEDIARYYRTYLELMRHWDAVLPGRILRVQHEDVVEDLEGNVRRILEFCGLQFETGVRRVPQDRAQRPHRELRAGAPADFPRRARPVAELRALAGPAQGRPGRCTDPLPGLNCSVETSAY